MKVSLCEKCEHKKSQNMVYELSTSKLPQDRHDAQIRILHVQKEAVSRSEEQRMRKDEGGQMTDDEKIKFIAQHTRMRFGDMAPFLGMRATAIVVFVDEHRDEIDNEIANLKIKPKEVGE